VTSLYLSDFTVVTAEFDFRPEGKRRIQLDNEIESRAIKIVRQYKTADSKKESTDCETSV